VVRHLVYVSAMLPDAGESLIAMVDPRSPGWLEPADDHGRVRIRSDLTDEEIHFHFTGDCDDDAARVSAPPDNTRSLCRSRSR
jgi:hypothetical protein